MAWQLPVTMAAKQGGGGVQMARRAWFLGTPLAVPDPLSLTSVGVVVDRLLQARPLLAF